MPATYERSSLARHCASQSPRNPHISQAAQRNGDRGRRRVDEALERALRAREVRVEIARPERLAATGAELDVHVLGQGPPARPRMPAL